MNNYRHPLKTISFAFITAFTAQTAFAQDNAELEELTVLGSQDDLEQLSGSAHRLGRDELEDFEYTDLNQVLVTVPGVYVRQEDGYGLRPNIGLRGVTSDRSQKITLMEDGILITPAPYAAPAAYYIPNINRMQAVEVFKGPAAIKFGPNTVGGAINLATRSVPTETTGEVDVSYGTDNFQKLRGLFSQDFGTFGYLVEGLHFSSDGFKELDGGGDTGFERNDINTRLKWEMDNGGDFYQRFDLKLGYADEDSDETYLGLTNADFDDNPVRRYSASSEDNFTSEHYQTHLIHQMQIGESWSMVNRLYLNRFDRSWLKYDEFLSGVNCNQPDKTQDCDTKDVLENPDLYQDYIEVLRGEQDSFDNGVGLLNIQDNDREYGSTGIDLNAAYETFDRDINHKIEFGLRYHYDYVERNHTPYAYEMTNGSLRKTSLVVPIELFTDNKGEANAISAYVHDTMTIGKWIINIGARLESIETEFTDNLDSSRNNTNNNTEVLPGLGVFFNLTDNWGLLAGINKGFSPNGPSPDDNVEPEESINYEFGTRYNINNLKAEAILFFSDYDNLIGRCRNNDSGCNIGDEFNAGRVEVGGVEASVEQVWQLQDYAFPLGVTYTYTESAFQESFQSGFSQWGVVQQGDELPYLPEHQARIYAGVRGVSWDILASLKYVDEMRDLPGQDSFDENEYTPALTTLDLSASYFINDNWTTQLVIDNVTDEQEPVSYRPFGARPNKPRTIVATVKYRF